MADPPRSPGTEEDPGWDPNRGTASRSHRWVFILGIVFAIALVGLMILLHLTGTLGPGVH